MTLGMTRTIAGQSLITIPVYKEPLPSERTENFHVAMSH